MKNPAGDKPQIDDSAWIAGSAVVMGNVRIEADVLVAPNAVIRADEPSASIVTVSYTHLTLPTIYSV